MCLKSATSRPLESANIQRAGAVTSSDLGPFLTSPVQQPIGKAQGNADNYAFRDRLSLNDSYSMRSTSAAISGTSLTL